MVRIAKIKDIHIRRRNGRWTAVWQGHRNARVVRHADTPELALISLLAGELLEPYRRAAVLAHLKFTAWLESNSLMDLRRRLLYAKGSGWDDISKPEAVRVYRKWRREQTGGTSLSLGE